ncbi:hypothetical protein NG696_06480 [Pseudarthrobacter sp. HLT1-5]|nr:hypothetical protein [Pseudarthrobacter sp. HLT1-5]MCO4254879.1 hypothetical protein [Pseudarthrobacter sp. HLT1-5]
MPDDEIPGGPWADDPFPEPQPAELHLPDNELPDYALLPDDMFPDDTLPHGPMPQDPYPNWDFSLAANSPV